MNHALAAVLILVFPLAASAGEKISGTNIYLTSVSSWQTGEHTGYWMVESEGVQLSADSPPSEGSPIECHGAGFWDKEGSWGEGICVVGSADDTHVTSWKKDKGEAVGQWAFVSGTGIFEGIMGQGTYSSTDLPGGRQISEWQGEMTLPE